MVVAGLFIRGIQRWHRADLGYRADHLLTVALDPTGPRYEQPETVQAFHREVLQRVASLPGVQSAGLTSDLPNGCSVELTFEIEGQISESKANRPSASYRAIDPGYLRTMGIR